MGLVVVVNVVILTSLVVVLTLVKIVSQVFVDGVVNMPDFR